MARPLRLEFAGALILHGAEDEGYPLPVVDKVVQELRGAKVPFQLEVYSGTGHGFSDPEEQGRGARQRAVDRLDCANAQRAFRQLRAPRAQRRHGIAVTDSKGTDIPQALMGSGPDI